MRYAHVPRQLRVRASVQVAGQRLPAAGFLLVAGVVGIGGIRLVVGADLERTIWEVGVVAITGLLLVEGRLWNRTTSAILRIVVRHARRPQRLWRTPVMISLPADSPPVGPIRRPRWMDDSHA